MRRGRWSPSVARPSSLLPTRTTAILRRHRLPRGEHSRLGQRGSRVRQVRLVLWVHRGREASAHRGRPGQLARKGLPDRPDHQGWSIRGVTARLTTTPWVTLFSITAEAGSHGSRVITETLPTKARPSGARSLRKDLKVRRAYKDRLVQRERREPWAQSDHRERRVTRGYKALRDKPALKAFPGQPAPPGCKVRWVRKDQPARRG